MTISRQNDNSRHNFNFGLVFLVLLVEYCDLRLHLTLQFCFKLLISCTWLVFLCLICRTYTIPYRTYTIQCRTFLFSVTRNFNFSQIVFVFLISFSTRHCPLFAMCLSGLFSNYVFLFFLLIQILFFISLRDIKHSLTYVTI